MKFARQFVDVVLFTKWVEIISESWIRKQINEKANDIENRVDKQHLKANYIELSNQWIYIHI